jgi:hypothetical protein
MSEQYLVVPLSPAQFRSIAFPLSPRLKIHAALLAFFALADPAFTRAVAIGGRFLATILQLERFRIDDSDGVLTGRTP